MKQNAMRKVTWKLGFDKATSLGKIRVRQKI